MCIFSFLFPDSNASVIGCQTLRLWIVSQQSLPSEILHIWPFKNTVYGDYFRVLDIKNILQLKMASDCELRVFLSLFKTIRLSTKNRNCTSWKHFPFVFYDQGIKETLNHITRINKPLEPKVEPKLKGQWRGWSVPIRLFLVGPSARKN